MGKRVIRRIGIALDSGSKTSPEQNFKRTDRNSWSHRQRISRNPWSPAASSKTPTMSPRSLMPKALVELVPGTSIVVKRPLLSRKPWASWLAHLHGAASPAVREALSPVGIRVRPL
jgi:hypothetical protein